MTKEEKMKAVEELKDLVNSYSLLGIVDVKNFPSKQMQEIKKKLRNKAVIKLVKKSILLRALEASDKIGMQELMKHIPLQPELVMTNAESFKFYGEVDKMKSPTYAKGGDVADDDIVVYAGPTSLMPGPVISEFAKVRIPAGVEEGKIAVKKDTSVVKKGGTISKDVANILRKLKIEPMKIGMNVVAILDNGVLYLKDVLSLVGEKFLNQVRQAHQEAVNLTVAIVYPTKESVGYLLSKAYRQAMAIEKIGGGK
jgi:large subunit ribosomal protein L10